MAKTWHTYAKRAQKLDALVLKAKRLSDQLLTGGQQSYFKGKGILFDEVRKYQPGDDVRSIHWNVTARLREPHIKLYKEEKNLTLLLLVDVSGSGIFGTRKQTKFDTITELCAVLALAAQKSNFSVGAVFFSDKLEKVIHPQKGKSNFIKILHFLAFLDVTGKQTSIKIALNYVLNIARKGNLVVVLSDFMDNSYTDVLKLMNLKHELLGIRVYDKSEAMLPAGSYMQILDAETGKSAIANTSSKRFGQSYHAWYQENETSFLNAFTKAGAGIINIATDEAYIEKLRYYFQKK
ncbi:hypothetical protein AAE02nite_18170 [Adhaeribacter aerolatus]|uniref:DUF58 domain-containing protein n=1 Tax=Adhaeribacter aerolatus TaxID=670289 RepID=A0A512AWQ9_9BACT|nr:DUF58 domain-containing protein [Adhaeribacter aerolatus]GEO04153.1 hypothetical protein AAE02nite_18170 [Adhaeribacter aerolatus]